MGSGKRGATKADTSPAKARRSPSKTIKSEGSFTATPRSTRKKGAVRENNTFSSSLPNEEQRRSNGRVAGRSLIVWGRPRMAEKLLLHIQYECARHKVNIPWDAIAHRLHPGSSGTAVMQHLNRLRKELIAEGHLVPPMPIRPAAGETSDQEIRGYVRLDMDGDDKKTTRPVRFDEGLDDRKFSLPDAYIEEAEEAEEGNEPEYHTPTRGTSEDGGHGKNPDSPTPIGRSHLPTSVGRRPTMSFRSELENGCRYQSPVAMNGLGEDTIGVDDGHLDPDVSMYASPEVRVDRDRCVQNGTGVPGVPCGMANGGIYPPPAHFRAAVGSEHHQPTYSYGSSLEPSAAQAQAQTHAHSETGVPASGLRLPFECYTHFPCGFTPWQVGHSFSPLSFYPVTGHERWEEKPAQEPMGTKVELSSPELVSSFETKLAESRMEDLIAKHGNESEIIETIDPADTIRL
ncbi:hypothetical protein ACRE_076600 [Hapsidospora chrysogenum ATCC 11550]|uniref:Uncharacterized protein n=1 Tax=Hapsidospora chrysogenum (strain ATCC 11550 / CBS 779.69 / DSM 880 / IAM 14645 / JCM 23072 / IMI 49137) TaxID=857340 RepID=A0A086SWZ6_HAPC1|nr:hypothetical protein ACRE_076600 [Hapsidospora chrysogenum ATCC 11550]